MRSEQCEAEESLDIASEPANKATTLMSPYFLSYVNAKSYRSGFSSIEMLGGEQVYSLPMAVMFPYFSPLFEAFNEKISLMLSNGLIDYWRYKLFSGERLKIKFDEIGPQVLTMDHLAIGFLFCLLPMTLSILAFVGEIVVFQVKSKFFASKHRK